MNSIVYNTDCMQGMKQYPDKHFDLAVVDPPYGIGAGSKSFKNRSSANKRAEKFYKDNDWDKCTPEDEYWQELMRVSKNWIVWGGNYFTQYLPPARCFIVWDKKTGKNSNARNWLYIPSSADRAITKFGEGKCLTNVYVYGAWRELLQNLIKSRNDE